MHLFTITMIPYLILNESTLFYLNLSTTKTSKAGKIQTWTAQVANANKNKKSKVSHPSIVTGTSTTIVSAVSGPGCTTTSSSTVVAQADPTTKPSKNNLKVKMAWGPVNQLLVQLHLHL